MRCAICHTENSESATSCRSCGSPLGIVAPHASYTLPVGTKLQGGAFSVGKVLGQGGFGITYQGSDLLLRRPVAIKEFFPVAQGCSRQGTTVLPSGSVSTSAYQEERKKCLEEAHRLAQFQHPGIVKVHSMFEENNTAYMVMEFLKGRTLMRMIEERGALPETEAVGYINQVGEALIVVHQANLLHRDIKPENVLVTDDVSCGFLATAPEAVAGRFRRISPRRWPWTWTTVPLQSLWNGWFERTATARSHRHRDSASGSCPTRSR
ncbi:MAG TPA: serine/threonine-protein kinase [Isosphaeraceae bacterium]|nr:serine/threonine-protein kinase [Isosphaeraceae bacterium]